MTEVKTITKKKKEPAKKERVVKKQEKAPPADVATEGIKEGVGIINEIDKLDKNTYFEAIGRRKTSVARVRFYISGKKEVVINDKTYNEYFPTQILQETCVVPLKKMKYMDKFRVMVKVSGGGVNSQSEAVRHGISRALVLFNPEFKKKLRGAGFLTRDPRQRERKKFGLKRARRAPQWKKR